MDAFNTIYMLNLLAYQLTRDGTLEKIAPPFLEYLISKNVLVFYAQKLKHLYIWIGRNASQTVKSNIANIQGRLLQLHPGSTFLRQITIEDGSEPFNFLELLALSKTDIEKKEDEFKQFRQKEIEEVREGIKRGKALFDTEKVEEAYQTLSEMLQRAIKLDVDELVEQADEIHKKAKAKKEWLEKLQVAKKELENLEKNLDDSLTIDKAPQAYEYSEKIRMLVDYQKGLEMTQALKEKIEKARQLYEEYQQKSNFTERSYFSEKAKFEEAVSYQDFESANRSLERMKEIAENAMDPHIKDDYEKKRQSFLPEYEKWSKQKEERQKEEEEIKKQIESIKNQLEESISKEDMEKSSNLLTILQSISSQAKNEAVQNDVRKIHAEYRQKLQKVEEKIRISKEIAEDLKSVDKKVAEGSYDSSLKTLQNNLIQAERIEATGLVEEISKRIEEISKIKKEKQEYEEIVKRLSIQIELDYDSLELDSAESNAKELLKIAETAKDEANVNAAKEKLQKIAEKKDKLEKKRKIETLKKKIEEIETKDHSKLADSKSKIIEFLEDPEIKSNDELRSLANSKLTLIKNLELKSEIITKIQSIEREIQNNDLDKAEQDCKALIELTQSALYDEERTFAEMKITDIQKMRQEAEIQKEKTAIMEEINRIPEPSEDNIDEILKIVEEKRKDERIAKYPEVRQSLEEKQRKAIEKKDRIIQEKKHKEAMQKVEAIPEPDLQNIDHVIKEIDELLEQQDIRENPQAKAKLEEKKKKALEIKERTANEEKAVKSNLEELSRAIEENDFEKAERLLKETEPKMQYIKDEGLKAKIQEQRSIYEKKEKTMQEKKEQIADKKQKAQKALEEKNYQEAIAAIDEGLQIAEQIKDTQTIENLTTFKQQIETEKKEKAVQEKKEQIAERKQKAQKALEEKNYQEAIAAIDESLQIAEQINDTQTIEHLIAFKQQIETEKKEKAVQEKKEQISERKQKAQKALEEKNYQGAIAAIDEGLQIAEEIQNAQIKEDLTAFKQQIETEKSEKESAEQQEQAIKTMIEQAEAAYKNKNFEESEKIIQEINSKYPPHIVEPYKAKIGDIDRRTAEAKQKYKEKLKEFNQIKATMEQELNEGKYLSAGENCKILVRMAEDLGFKEEETVKLKEKSKTIEELLQKEREKKKLEREEVLKTLEAASAIMEPEKDVLPDIVEISIQDSIGNISEDLDSMMTALNNVLETQRVEIKNEVSSKSILKSKSGEIIELERKSKVVESSETATSEPGSQGTEQPAKGPVKLSFSSGLENPLDDVIEEAILQDVIPYNFEVTEFHVEGINLDKEPEKEMTKDGLQYTWFLKDIEPKQKVEINYDLRRRVSRTVIVPVQDQLKVIKTHSNLEFLNVEGLYDAKLKFVNHFGDNVKGIVIEDIIPLYYLYNIKYPDNQKPKGIEKSNNGALIKWNIKEFDKEQVAIHQYRLMEIYKFEELKIETRSLSKQMISAVKNRDFPNSIETINKILNKLSTYSS